MNEIKKHKFNDHKTIIYVDMDGCLCDFKDQALKYGIDLSTEEIVKHNSTPEKQEKLNLAMCDPWFWINMEPMEDAIESFHKLNRLYTVYILSSPVYNISASYVGKQQWISRFLGLDTVKQLILCHNKSLLKGDILIDDREVNGAKEFEGKFIQFGTELYSDWNSVLSELYYC